MSTVWEAPSDITALVREIHDLHHHHLLDASIWSLVSDGNGVSDNRLIVTRVAKCTKTEKLKSGHDFKITVMAETWSKLTDQQRRIAIDEALCRCGVKYLPETVEINGKREILKDDLGRTIYSDEVSRDADGTPRWKINRPDCEAFFAMVERHDLYSEDLDNLLRTLNGRPLKVPIAANRADTICGDQELA